MEKEKLQVNFSIEAEESIFQISAYITEKGYPETAEKFAAKLYEFGNLLVIFPYKYTTCSNVQLAKQKMRCAPYKNYIFIYKVIRNKLIIYNVVHGSAIR